MKEISILILTIFISFQTAFSQSPPFIQFKTGDGLPSPNVYDCMQDSEGYMWFATEKGASRFDSYSFRNFSQKDGLNSDFIMNMIEKDNKVFVANKKDGINVFEIDSIYKLYYHDTVVTWIDKLVLHKNAIYKFNSYTISILEGDNLKLIYSVYLNPNMQDISKFPVGAQIKWMHSVDNERLIAATSEGLYEIKEKQFERLSIEGMGNPVLYCVTSDGNNKVYVSGDNVIYKIRDDKVIDTYAFHFTKEQKINRLLVDRKNNIWFFVMNEGLFRFNPENNHLTDLNKTLDAGKLHVNAMYMDSKNNVWVCTYGEGVYCFFNTFINNYNIKDGISNSKINSVSGDKDGRIYCGTFNHLSVLERDSFTVIKSPGEVTNTDYVYSLNKANDSLFTICVSNKRKEFGNINYKNVKLIYSPFRSSIFINDDTLIVGTWSNLAFKFNPFTNRKPYLDTSLALLAIGSSHVENEVTGLFKDNRGKIWMASEKAVSLLDGNKVSVINGTESNGKYHGIKEDRNGFAWVNGERGLFIIKDTSIVYKFAKGQNENVSSFEFGQDGKAWLATSEGLSGMSVKYDNGTIELKEEYLLNENSGLISNDISSLYYDNARNILWAGTSGGLSSIDLDGLEQLRREPLDLRILEVKTSDSVYNLKDPILFPDYKDEINITVSAFDINSRQNLKYKYILTKEDTVWNTSNSNVIYFPSLAYGDYDFQIYAEDNFRNVSAPELLNFTVKTPFEKSYLFYALVGLVAVSVTGFGVSRSLKKKYMIEKERGDFKNQISDLKQKSLASMMNPHFVFNSLNSIQSFYNYNETESANEYLAKFSRLIRMNLDYADRTFIKLSEELERLESYLILEKMRFNENLNYEIWTADDIDPEKTEIPNMIIQPFVENAIWHGILKSHKAGSVTINVFHAELPEEIRNNYKVQSHDSLNNKYSAIEPKPVHCIKVEIIDNGIGIKNCQKNKTSDHISRGISVIKERLSILHHYTGETDLVTITDRSDLPDPETGTIVEIYLTPNVYKVN